MAPRRHSILRSEETNKRYQNAPQGTGGCFMCDRDCLTVIKEYQDWMIVENDYPYDTVAKIHHMLIPKAHVSFAGLNSMDVHTHYEFNMIKDLLNKEGLYDCIMENFTAAQSQPQHLHYHLLSWKTL